VLGANGIASLGSDTLRITSFGERALASTLFCQGDVQIAPTSFGDGLWCLGGTLKRLYLHDASMGVVAAPGANEPPISAQSSVLGDPIPAGAVRYYQAYYRDPSSTFCTEPAGNTWNASNAVYVVWNP